MITQSRLKELLHYDPDTGVFTWLVTRGGNAKAGSAAALKSPNNRGYQTISLDNQRYQAHRVAWLYVHGSWPDGHIDHINHNKLDNRLINLRVVGHQDNARNVKRSAANTSGITGVSWCNPRSKWEAHIRADGRKLNLGRYHDLFDAICARKSAELTYGYHSNHGRLST